MDKNLIKKNYKKKIELYNYYNKKYYDENISEITDAAFDDLKNEIIDLEKKNTFLSNKKSPLQKCRI
jgi:DNA ligase (NAD+)